MESESGQAKTALVYGTLVLIWSTTPLAVVWSIAGSSPVWVLVARMGLAALLALAVLAFTGEKLRWDRQAFTLYALGALSMFGAMFFTYLGAVHLPSALISVMFGTSPLLVALLSLLMLPGYAIAGLQWLGMALALLGLAAVFRLDHPGEIDRSSLLLVFLGVLSYVVSAVMIKRGQVSLPPMVQTTGALLVSALAGLLVLPFFWSERPEALPSASALLALLYSASLGSIVAMLCYFFLLQRISAASVAMTTVLTPVIALVLGVLFNHERFDGVTLLGMALIMAGVTAYYGREVRALLLGKRRAQ